MYRCENLTTRAVTLPANVDATLSRVDSIILQVQDASEDTGSQNQAQVTSITGGVSAGASLDSLNGVVANTVSPTYIVLANAVVGPGNVPALSNTYIRDRRQFALVGSPPGITTQKNIALFDSSNGVPFSTYKIIGSAHASSQAAVAVYLPRRIAATHIRWRYHQGATTQIGTAQSWNIAICDASGRLIGQTGSKPFAGTVGTIQSVLAPFSPALPNGYIFEMGWYYVWFGVSAIPATAEAYFLGYSADNQTFNAGSIALTPNLFYKLSTGGVVFDMSNTILNMTDSFADVISGSPLPVPAVSLSIG